MSTKRIFFALWPDDRQRDQLRHAISPIAKLVEGNAVYRGDWHVTLVFIGSFPENRVPVLLHAAKSVQFEPFRLRFDRAEYWPRPKVAVLSSQTTPPALERLVDALKDMLAKGSVPVETSRFHPHVTIVRRARPFETQRLAQPVVIEWSGFELVESGSVPGGPKYRPLKQ